MADMGDPKTALHHYLQETRDALVWKLDGLSERDARLPRTPTGNNLLGVLKHCLNVEAGYFGPTFGREFPTPHELLSMETYAQDPQADWYAKEEETKDGLIDLYRRVWVFADQTIEELPLDASGRVPWWQSGRQEVTLQRIIVHVIYDLAATLVTPTSCESSTTWRSAGSGRTATSPTDTTGRHMSRS
jgi:uncharacterized damage-inducible protein DinB